MPIVKISDLNNLTTGLDSADIFPLVDLSADETKKITAKNLFDEISFSKEETYTVGTGGDFATIEEVQAFLDQRRLSRGKDSSKTRQGNVTITIEFLAGDHKMPTNNYWNIENLGYYLYIKGQSSADTNIVFNDAGDGRFVINNSHVMIDAINVNLPRNYAFSLNWGGQLYLGGQVGDFNMTGGIYLDHGSILKTYNALNLGVGDLYVDNNSYARVDALTCDDIFVYDARVYADNDLIVADDIRLDRSTFFCDATVTLSGTLTIQEMSTMEVWGDIVTPVGVTTMSVLLDNGSLTCAGIANSNSTIIRDGSKVIIRGYLNTIGPVYVERDSRLHLDGNAQIAGDIYCRYGSNLHVDGTLTATSGSLFTVYDDSKLYTDAALSLPANMDLDIYSKGVVHVNTDADIFGGVFLDDHSIFFVDNTLNINSLASIRNSRISVNSSKFEAQTMSMVTSATETVITVTDNSDFIVEEGFTFTTTATTSTPRWIIDVYRNANFSVYTSDMVWNNNGNATNATLFGVSANGSVFIETGLTTTLDQASNKIFDLIAPPCKVNVASITSTMDDTVQGIQRNQLLSGIEFGVGTDSASTIPLIKQITTGTPATDGQVLSWDSATSSVAWATVGGLDSASVIDVLENTSVAGGVLTTFNNSSAVMGFGAVNIDNRPDAVPVDTTAFGAEAMQSLGTGQANTGFGHTVLSGLTTGSNNTAVGADAMGSVTTSTSNSTAIGLLAGHSTTGNSNVFVGMQAGQANGTSKESVYIGYRAAESQASSGTDGTNNIVIGTNASKSTGSVNNEITLGNTSITRFRIPGLGYEVFDSAGSLIFELNGTRVMRLDASGNLAIAGTLSQSQTL